MATGSHHAQTILWVEISHANDTLRACFNFHKAMIVVCPGHANPGNEPSSSKAFLQQQDAHLYSLQANEKQAPSKARSPRKSWVDFAGEDCLGTTPQVEWKHQPGCRDAGDEGGLQRVPGALLCIIGNLRHPVELQN